MRPMFWMFAASVTLAVTSIPTARGQTPPTVLRGTIVRVEAAALAVKAADGAETTVTLPSDLIVTALVDRTLADIKPGDFVGSAAVAGTDHKLHAQEVHIFPENLRGMGEGHRPMSGQDRSMTNAVVAGVAGAPDGQDLHLTYPGGEQTVEVSPGTRIVGIVPAERAILVPGSPVLVVAAKQPDGSLRATFVQGQKDGVRPLD